MLGLQVYPPNPVLFKHHGMVFEYHKLLTYLEKRGSYRWGWKQIIPFSGGDVVAVCVLLLVSSSAGEVR